MMTRALVQSEVFCDRNNTVFSTQSNQNDRINTGSDH